MPDKLETRSYRSEVTFEERADGQSLGLKGLAIPYDEFDGSGPFREKFAAGAFDESLRKGELDVLSFFNHDRSQILGRMSNKTLRVDNREDGLYYEVDPNPDTTTGRDVYAYAKRRDIKGTSIGFISLEDEWGEDEQGMWRIVRKADLFEVSPEVTPWYSNTDVAVRSMEAWKEEQQKSENKDEEKTYSLRMVEVDLDLAERAVLAGRRL